MIEIYSKSNHCMNEVEDGSAHLVVTSPPYYNAIDYKKHLSGRFFRHDKSKTLESYFEEMKNSFTEVYKKMKEGGFCAIVIGDILTGSEIIPLYPHFYFMMNSLGFVLHQNIVWNKVTGGASRFGVTIQHPYPSYYYPNQMTENILIFRKGKIVRKKDERSKIVIDDVMKKEIANNVWHIAPVPPNQYNHPCPFPEEIPFRLIVLYSNVGDMILDPFNGIGTTTKVAKNLNRYSIGYDIIEKYCVEAEKRLGDSLFLREQLIPKYIKFKGEQK